MTESRWAVYESGVRRKRYQPAQDRGNSGMVCFARNEAHARHLAEVFAEREENEVANANGEEKEMPKKEKKAKREKLERIRDERLPGPGGLLKRSYKGKEIEVKVLTNTFVYKDKEYSSLSAVAKAITGYKAISGQVFFGLWKSQAESKPHKKKAKSAA